MGGMTPVGKVYTLARQESLNGLHTIEFLDHLLRASGERLLVIWDGSPIHRRLAVKEYVSGTDARIWLEALPPYAPDLNPWDEGGWHHLKAEALRNQISSARFAVTLPGFRPDTGLAHDTQGIALWLSNTILAA
jgi:hypothetical protein